MIYQACDGRLRDKEWVEMNATQYEIHEWFMLMRYDNYVRKTYFDKSK